MAKLIIKIDLGDISKIGGAEALRREAEQVATGDFSTDVWFAKVDRGLIAIDEAHLRYSRADDSFITAEFVGVEE